MKRDDNLAATRKATSESYKALRAIHRASASIQLPVGAGLGVTTARYQRTHDFPANPQTVAGLSSGPATR